ncbi:MAG TPA: hypothetical protein VF677_06815 [Flavobacterium sp.]
MDTDFEKCTVFRSNELSGAQKVLLPLLLSRFPLYLRKKAQDAAAIGAIKKNFVFSGTREQWCAGITLKNRQAPSTFPYSFVS